MKILLAEHFGMCFGVRDAIAQAETLATAGPLTVLGELVHNPVVRERLRAQGVQESALDSLTDPEISARVMITAHGASDARRKHWRAAGYAVADGTCPLVRHAHTRLQALVAAGYFPVVIGQPGHVEVRGLTEDFSEAVVLGEMEEIAELPSHARYGVVSQTTQPIERVRRFVDAIRRARPEAEVRFADTVCKPTKDRQEALRKLLAQAEVIVVVGGRASNNTRQLVVTCRSAGRRAVHIERAEELSEADFENVAVVGVTAGTSTLAETVEAVLGRLRNFSEKQTNGENAP
ncbi:MAG: 4-hydroxy-3-methylbut-2-enyl diphosphate reductase [Chthoniobacterales bacterium]|nr:4-hydroxy-3-methylbut-2-enyl diphosphate reductase [Chthoniobacterales bacterium]